MIGFELNGVGSNGFKQSRGAWTEGSLIALKGVMSLPKVNLPGSGGFNRGIIGNIEDSFSKIAKIKLDTMSDVARNIELTLTGDIKMTYSFPRTGNATTIKNGFLVALGSAHGDLGDQVMIHMCAMITDLAVMNLTNNDQLSLTIDVDL